MGVARKRHVSHFLIQCVPISAFVSRLNFLPFRSPIEIVSLWCEAIGTCYHRMSRPNETRLTTFNPCVPISVLPSHKNTIYHNIVHRKLPGCVDTKVSEFYPIIRPFLCSIGGVGNDKRQHDKYIFGKLYLFFFKWFYQSILDLDIAGNKYFCHCGLYIQK